MGFPSPDPRLFGVAQQLADQRGEQATESGSQAELAAERHRPDPPITTGPLAKVHARLSRAIARLSGRPR